MSNTPDSGRIWLEHGRIHYASRDYGSWELSVVDLKLYGEYTTDQGPFVDDWFMVFVSSDGRWYEASTYADASCEFRKQLVGFLGIEDLLGDLSVSTDFNSRILWPIKSRGLPLFRFTRVELPLWQRIKRFGIGEIKYSLSDEAKQYVTEHP